MNDFTPLKQGLCNTLVLKKYNEWSKTDTDSSMYGYHGFAVQKYLVDNCFLSVYYMSMKTLNAQRKYPVNELELILVVIKALKIFEISFSQIVKLNSLVKLFS